MKVEREPSYQTVSFIAQTFNSSVDYLYGKTDDKNATTLTISAKDEPDLFFLVESIRNDSHMLERLLAYANEWKQSPPPVKRVARLAGYNPLTPDSVSRRPRLSLRSSHY
ncbi:hypothetical protein ACTQ25_15690, partial [Fusicatenibacter saccharivorans]